MSVMVSSVQRGGFLLIEKGIASLPEKPLGEHSDENAFDDQTSYGFKNRDPYLRSI